MLAFGNREGMIIAKTKLLGVKMPLETLFRMALHLPEYGSMVTAIPSASVVRWFKIYHFSRNPLRTSILFLQ
jgi:hypothetical protein